MQRDAIINATRRYVQRYWGLIALVLWGGVIIAAGMVRFTPYYLAESSARALLLTWSLVQSVATPIPLAKLPDMRALLLFPVAVYWPGSMVAAKVFSMLVAFAAVALLYHWSKRTAGREVALIASAALLIAPLTIKQIDALGAGPFLLLAIALGGILDRRYQISKRLFGGLFFSQLLLIAFSVSLHPAGLAYPLALAWNWFKRPVETTRQRFFLYFGLVMAPLFVFMLHVGWVNPQWLTDPLVPLMSIFTGTPTDMIRATLLWGLLIGFVVIVVCLVDYRFLSGDLLGRILLLGVIIGSFAADDAWAMLALTLLLYRGTLFLTQANDAVSRTSVIGQRGLVLLTLFAIATFFMVADKTYDRVIAVGALGPTDQLIHSLASETAEVNKQVHVASQWPGRTMIVCKCYVLPLPPPAQNGQALLQQVHGVDYLIFDPQDPDNRQLDRNISQLSGYTETIAIQSGGVIIKLHPNPAAGAPRTPPPARR